MYQQVIIVKSPVTTRYVNAGDEATIDTANNQIRVGGVWFRFDHRWETTPQTTNPTTQTSTTWKTN